MAKNKEEWDVEYIDDNGVYHKKKLSKKSINDIKKAREQVRVLSDGKE